MDRAVLRRIANLEACLANLPPTVGERTEPIRQVRLGDSIADLAVRATASEARWLVLACLTALGALVAGIARVIQAGRASPGGPLDLAGAAGTASWQPLVRGRLDREILALHSMRTGDIQQLETDYLVIGAGASAMAFVDTLLAHSDHDVILLDRRHAPGGHWLDAYPFVRLHQPSAIYGVESMPLGEERIETEGPDAGYYERASAAEICAYYEKVLRQRMLPTGRVRFVAGHEFEFTESNEHIAVSRLTGLTCRIHARRALVDARYLEAVIPACHPPPFPVAPGMRFVPPNALPGITHAPNGFTVIGAGKTAMDCCIWLLDNGVSPDSIRWVRPRDAWLSDRSCLQPLDLAVRAIACVARTTKAAAEARDISELFRRLQAVGLLVALDPDVEPGTFRGAQTSEVERNKLRRIKTVVRAGYVSALTPERIEMEHGAVPTDPAHIHIDCTANALTPRPARPIFEDGLITLQSIRFGLTCFNAAITAYIEATRSDRAEKNRLCPPCPLPSDARDWLAIRLNAMQAEVAWSREPDIKTFMYASRLNILRRLDARSDDPQLQEAMSMLAQHRSPAMDNLRRLGAARRTDN